MKKILFTLMIACTLTGTAIARDLPGYYPAEGFQRTGTVQAVYAGENRVVIGDISFRLSKTVVVHSLSSKNDSLARLRIGARVGYTMGKGRIITEFWLLPRNYKRSKKR